MIMYIYMTRDSDNIYMKYPEHMRLRQQLIKHNKRKQNEQTNIHDDAHERTENRKDDD